ncbi:Cytochrome P450 9e2, partial [Pseudolycoriella hygida]
MISIIFLLFAVVGYLAQKWVKRNFQYFEERNIPYMSPNLFSFFKKQSLPDMVINLYNEFKNEKINGLFQFMTPVYLVRDPELIKRMAVKDFDFFMDHRVVIDENLDALFGKALISLTGQKWK